jgi:hypothetical protein
LAERVDVTVDVTVDGIDIRLRIEGLTELVTDLGGCGDRATRGVGVEAGRAV